MPDALLVGNNLAVLVAAAELGALGREVVLVTDGRPAGGHFRGLRLDGADFDIGMVLLESAAGPEETADLSSYRPRVRYDWTRFGALVDRWLDGQVDQVRTPTPEVLVDGRRWPDHLIANRLDLLAAGGFPAPPPLPRDDARHAAAKVTSGAYDTLTYQAAADLNHGTGIQRQLIDPFAEKLLGPAYDGLAARYHRAGWLPLYWPETLTAAIEGRPTHLAEYPFWTTGTGFVGELVRSLERRIADLPAVRVCGAAVDSLAPGAGGWEVRTAEGAWSHALPVLGVGHERAQALLGLPGRERAPGASVVAVCCLVRAAAMGAPIGCLSVVDREFVTYRVTDQDALAGRDPEWHRVVIEAGPAAADRLRDGEDVPAALVSELCRLLALPESAAHDGLSPDVRVVKTLSAPGAVLAPTAGSLAADAAAHQALVEACPAAELTGALLGVGATSMNDQVVQGLAVAQRLA
jgi:hypothetical protein